MVMTGPSAGASRRPSGPGGVRGPSAWATRTGLPGRPAAPGPRPPGRPDWEPEVRGGAAGGAPRARAGPPAAGLLAVLAAAGLPGGDQPPQQHHGGDQPGQGG